MILTTALQIAAFVLFVIAAVGIPTGRVSLVAAGLACWTLSLLIAKIA